MSTPNFESINTLEALLRKHVNVSAVDQAIEDYKEWASNLKENEKEITHLLYLLKTTEQRSGKSNLKHDHKISEIILSKAKIPSPDRRHNNETSHFTLLHKEIGNKYQIDVEFQNHRGTKVKKSISDHAQII